MIYEVYFLIRINEKIDDMKNINKLIKEHEGLKWDDYSPELKKQLKSIAFLLLFIVWFFVGLLSSQWFLFLLFLLSNFFIFVPISKLVGFPHLIYFTSVLNTVLGIIFATFLIINKYHLHLDTFQIFRDWIDKYGI